MNQPTSLGKLKNLDGGKELKFSLNPSDFKLSKSFEFHSEGCQGQSAPLVSFKSGGHATLSFDLCFDVETDSDCKMKDVRAFLESLNIVHEKNQSVPQLEFGMGTFTFKGYASQATFHALRFNATGEITMAKVSFNLISSGEYENAKA
jgi:hypothetical protein